MLTVEEALDQIVQTIAPLDVVSLSLKDSLGMTLGNTLKATSDSPPFSKALMDGFAITTADAQSGLATLSIRESVMAGEVPRQELQHGTAIRIMTGAPLPSGCEVVVPIEDCQVDEISSQVIINCQPLKRGANVLFQGEILSKHEELVQRGTLLRSQHLALLAEQGHAFIPVRPKPKLAVLPTGDELVPVDQIPGPGEIRNSNEMMLLSQALHSGAESFGLGIAPDVPKSLEERIHVGLQADLLVLSGGVSMGDKDYVPKLLKTAGVREIFHKVNLKPGKPIWFGRISSGENRSRTTYVFGLPGNPVSSFVCFELFVRTAIRKLVGRTDFLPKLKSVPLDQPHLAKVSRTTYYPAYYQCGDVCGDLSESLKLLHWKGSADLVTLAQANALARLTPTTRGYSKGENVPVLLLDS